MAGPFRYGSVNDLVGHQGKVYVAAGSEGGVIEFDPASKKSRLMTRKGWKTDNFYDSGVYELAAGAEGLFALRGKTLFKLSLDGNPTFINEGWGYVKGMAVLGGKIYVIDGEDFFVSDLAPNSNSRHLASEWYNCQDLEVVGGKLVALCQDRLWVVQPDGSRRQLGARSYSDPKGIADVGGQVHLLSSTFHGHDVNANDKHEASIYRIDWSGKAVQIAPLAAPWNIRSLPHNVSATGNMLVMPREHDGGYSDDRQMLLITL